VIDLCIPRHTGLPKWFTAFYLKIDDGKIDSVNEFVQDQLVQPGLKNIDSMSLDFELFLAKTELAVRIERNKVPLIWRYHGQPPATTKALLDDFTQAGKTTIYVLLCKELDETEQDLDGSDEETFPVKIEPESVQAKSGGKGQRKKVTLAAPSSDKSSEGSMSSSPLSHPDALLGRSRSGLPESTIDQPRNRGQDTIPDQADAPTRAQPEDPSQARRRGRPRKNPLDQALSQAENEAPKPVKRRRKRANTARELLFPSPMRLRNHKQARRD
jgi:hypothetical protein